MASNLKIVCLGETQESVDALLDSPKICRLLNDRDVCDKIKTLHITDLKWYNNFDLVLKAQISARSLDEIDKVLQTLLLMAE